MKAIVCNNFGPIKDIEYKEVEEPKFTEKDILIKVSSVGVNFPDGLLVQGKYQLKPETPLFQAWKWQAKLSNWVQTFQILKLVIVSLAYQD